MNGIKFLRFPQVVEKTGRTRPSINYLIKHGQFPRPILLSARAVGFPASEVEQILNAQVRGFSVDQIRSLVCQIHAQRMEAQAC